MITGNLKKLQELRIRPRAAEKIVIDLQHGHRTMHDA
jgi:hypothetical protein